MSGGSVWTRIIKPHRGWFDVNLKELWHYRDLIGLFVKRDFVSVYKQTVLGPFWFVLQPVIQTILFAFVFGTIAEISTDGMPQVLFYMSGIVTWTYFADCLNKSSSVLVSNAHIFGKVYFPRLAVPVSIIISNLIKFGIQFMLFLSLLAYYYFKGTDVHPNSYILLIPLLLLIMAGTGMGLGIIISSFTTKYRDLSFMIAFGIQLLMYITPVIYPLSFIPEKYRWIITANPMTAVVETFRYSFLGSGTFNPFHLLYSFLFMLVVITGGILIFNKTEKDFIDTV